VQCEPACNRPPFNNPGSVVLENIFVSNRLTGGPALPIVFAIPFVAVSMHVDQVGLPAKPLDYRTTGASNGCTYETANKPMSALCQ
jgi:hypothetical protein